VVEGNAAAEGVGLSYTGKVDSRKEEFPQMKEGIHPAYNELSVICACGNQFKTRSSHKGDIRVEICSNCHPYFTGKQKLVDTEGRVDRFQKKIAKTKAIQDARKPN
jgi:large subunit ribosomal protein L31